jgi:hypothetical protein
VASPTAPVLDTYAPLSHKAPLSDTRGTCTLAPVWVSKLDQRRLTAYKILAGYRANVARAFLPAHVDEAERDNRREYGDADLLVDRVRAGVLGDGPEIVIDGANVDLADEPDLPPEPEPLEGEVSDIRRRVQEIREARWAETAAAVVDEWESAWAQRGPLQERQRWLRSWADVEQFWSKKHEGEGDTVGLGDGVYEFAWSTRAGRPILRVYDPGFYFPVITDESADQDFPPKVHIAWEYETPDGRRWLRRKTWELGPILPAVDEAGEPLAAEDGADLVFVRDGDRVDPKTGEIVRDLPWNFDEAGAQVPSAVTCYFTDATWELVGIDLARGFDDLSLDGARFAAADDGRPARRTDLQIDFLPIVHVPNTPASREHFGASILLVVAQLLDDLASSDTDVMDASELAAGPMVALFGAGADAEIRVKPGTMYKVDKDGRMDVLDLTAGLGELRAVNEGLLDRLSVNGRVPGEVLGRVQASQDRSGIHLALSFGPFSLLVGTLRMTREFKDQLGLKFVQRFAQLGGVLPPGRNPPARIAFGPFLPTDRSALVDQVTKLLDAGAASTQTAVAWLVAGGFSVDDARGEVDRIRYETPARARDIADATGSEELAADYLGVDLPEAATVAEPPTGTPPVIGLPPAGPAGGAGE